MLNRADVMLRETQVYIGGDDLEELQLVDALWRLER